MGLTAEQYLFIIYSMIIYLIYIIDIDMNTLLGTTFLWLALTATLLAWSSRWHIMCAKHQHDAICVLCLRLHTHVVVDANARAVVHSTAGDMH